MSNKLSSLLLVLILAFFSSFSFAADSKPLAWRSYSPAVFEQAKREHKWVLTYGKVSWCHWCQKMDRTTFSDPALVKLIMRDFVPVKVDLGQDPSLGARFHITEIPTVLILNPFKQEMKRFSGFASAPSLMKKLSGFETQYNH